MCLGHDEAGALMNGISILIEDLTAQPTPSTMWGYNEEPRDPLQDLY